jgi:hypothetical protein
VWILLAIAAVVLIAPLRNFVWINATPLAIALLVLIGVRGLMNLTGHTVGSLLGMPSRDRRCSVCRGRGTTKNPVQTGWDHRASVPIHDYVKGPCQSCSGSGTVHY